MRHSTSNGTDQYQHFSPNLLTPYREQPRSPRIVVAYPWPAFSATKRANHTPINFDDKAKFLKAKHHAEKKISVVSRSMVV